MCGILTIIDKNGINLTKAKKCLKKSLSLQHKLINIFGNEITHGGKLIL